MYCSYSKQTIQLIQNKPVVLYTLKNHLWLNKALSIFIHIFIYIQTSDILHDNIGTCTHRYNRENINQVSHFTKKESESDSKQSNPAPITYTDMKVSKHRQGINNFVIKYRLPFF